MNLTGNSQLEKHTFLFAQAVRTFVKSLPPTLANIEDTKMLVKSSGMLGEKFIRSNESASRNDFLLGIKSCCGEAKTAHYWLQLIDTQSVAELEHQRQQLTTVVKELATVFSSMLAKAQA